MHLEHYFKWLKMATVIVTSSIPRTLFRVIAVDVEKFIAGPGRGSGSVRGAMFDAIESDSTLFAHAPGTEEKRNLLGVARDEMRSALEALE